MKRQFFSRHMLYHALVPAFVSSAALALANIADAVVVGNRVGEAGLAAIGIVTPIYMVYNILGCGLAAGASVLHARLVAGGQEREAQTLFDNIMGTALFFSLLIAVLGNLLLTPLLSALGAGDPASALFSYCRTYARPLLIAAPIFILSLLFYFYLRSDDDPWLSGAGFTVGSVLDLALNIILVLILHMGVLGAALATVFAQTAGVLVMLPHFLRRRGLLRLERPRLGFRAGWDAFRLGASSSVRYLFQFLFLFLANNLLMRATGIDGTLYVAVFDVVMNVSYIACALFDAAGDAIQPLEAVFYAERDRECLDDTVRLGLHWGVGCGMAVDLLLAVFARNVAELFGLSDPVSQALAIRAIRWYCASVFFAGVLLIFIKFYQAVEKERFAAVVTGLRTAILLLPATFLLGTFAPAHFWLVFLISEAGSFCIALFFARRRGYLHPLQNVPVISVTLENDSRELGAVLEQVERFCEEQGATPRQTNTLVMAIEEICETTIARAFTGRSEEYIQVTAVAENGEMILHIRNSAEHFNPLEMRMGRVTESADDELMESVGILAVKKMAKEFYFRRNDGFNMLTVKA